MHQFVLEYSCYDNRLKVLLDGVTPLTRESAVMQYAGRPFYDWCEVILGCLYREIFEDYALLYIGRDEEAEILHECAEKDAHCRQWAHREPQYAMSLQERMQALSKWIRPYQAPALPPVHREITFCANRAQLARFCSRIQQLKVQNPYCHLTFEMKEYPDSAEQDAIYLAEDFGGAERVLREKRAGPYAFILVEGEQTGFLAVRDRFFLYGFREEDFFEAVFRALLLFPLLACFRQYMQALIRKTGQIGRKERLIKLLIVKPYALVTSQAQIEIGCSIPLDVRMIPPDAPVPEFVFECRMPGIVECTQTRIYGRQEGATQVLVYEKGEFSPVGTLNLTVFRRNRITQLTISDDFRDCGEGDTFYLTCAYAPEDADNADAIEWYSENPDIIEVTDEGCVHAVACGECRVFCVAERVSASCMVRSRPYLTHIRFKDDLETGCVHMEVGERRTVECEMEPPLPHDGRLILASRNLMVANVSGWTIIGVSDGVTEVVVENNTHRVQRVIRVSVGTPERDRPRRRRFFGLLD